MGSQGEAEQTSSPSLGFRARTWAPRCEFHLEAVV